LPPLPDHRRGLLAILADLDRYVARAAHDTVTMAAAGTTESATAEVVAAALHRLTEVQARLHGVMLELEEMRGEE
jgi:hypothetical protein